MPKIQGIINLIAQFGDFIASFRLVPHKGEA